MPVIIHLPGEPRGKGRPRFFVHSGSGKMTSMTPKETVSYENALRHEAAIAMNGRPLMDEALHVRMTACFSIPASWSAYKRSMAIQGHIKPMKKPDADNLMKCLDALNQVVFVDDKQIVEATISKRYSLTPALTVEVWAA